MKNKPNIAPFLKRYKAAIASKSSEMRLSIEEATAIVTAFVELESSNNNIEKKFDILYNEIKSLKNNSNNSASDYMDGGTF